MYLLHRNLRHVFGRNLPKNQIGDYREKVIESAN